MTFFLNTNVLFARSYRNLLSKIRDTKYAECSYHETSITTALMHASLQEYPSLIISNATLLEHCLEITKYVLNEKRDRGGFTASWMSADAISVEITGALRSARGAVNFPRADVTDTREHGGARSRVLICASSEINPLYPERAP